VRTESRKRRSTGHSSRLVRRGGSLSSLRARRRKYGEDWHKAGYKTTKPNTWNDAIACAEWLIASKPTSPAKLSIQGGSASGTSSAVRSPAAGSVRRRSRSGAGVRHRARGILGQWRSNIPEFGTVKTEEGFKGLYAMARTTGSRTA
jgi:prolyl oligopeptidase